MMKHKDARQKKFSKGAVFFLICVVSLMLAGWGFSGNSKANNLRVTNQTTAFEVVNAEIVGDVVNLTLKNVSEKTINGYTLALNRRTLLQADFTIGSFTIAPGQIEETTVPFDPNEPPREIEVQAVVFTDRSFNGSVTAANSILHRREGMKTQLQAVQRLLDNAVGSSDNQLPGTMGQLVREVASLPEGSDDGPRNRALRFGLRDAKADIQKMLQSVNQESSHEKNSDLRQRLAELRSKITEWANRL